MYKKKALFYGERITLHVDLPEMKDFLRCKEETEEQKNRRAVLLQV